MPELLLDENHIYHLDGRQIDGLTSTIAEAGLGWKADPWYMGRGTAVHLATEFYDKGTLDEDSVADEIKGYLESWKQLRRDQNFTSIPIPTYTEFKTYHPELLVGCKIDRLPGPIDLKSGSPEAWHILQIAVQWSALICHGMHDLARSPMDIYLDPTGGPPKVKAYKTSELREAFKAYCSMLHFLRWRREKYGNSN
jgi:hypothetical protein